MRITGPNGLISRVGYAQIVLALALLAVGLLAVILSSSSKAATGVFCDGHAATIVGTSGRDTLRGTPGPDVINGRGGRDLIFGKGGRDRLCGSGDHDIIFGGKSDLSPGSGNDRLFGGSGDDALAGEDGSDDLFGFNGEDRLVGGDQADLLKGGGEDDALFGDEGNDSLDGGENSDACDGGSGRNTEVRCEPADVSVRVVGPQRASDGAVIRYKVIVKNHGPAELLDYKLDVETDNVELACENHFEDGVQFVDDRLNAGRSRERVFRVTCDRESPIPGQNRLQASVFGGTPSDRVGGNNKDEVTTTVE